MAEICTVIFDMDEVMMNREPIHHTTEIQIFTEPGVQIPEEHHHHQYPGTASREMWTKIIETFQFHAF